ncbi:helix-turn-helix domain-containing protein [Pseudonocardia sp. RS010]|uniref:helix-turn-helix domain-containing protein n=1 Tax=Pseudonocardia sp. RS010 TaxID=3385979 RepID=UPI0039A2244D
MRRERGHPIRVRRATIIMASSSGTPTPAIARLVAADEDTVRDVIHAFNEKGLAALDPQWAGGRPRLISDTDIAFIVTTASTRPGKNTKRDRAEEVTSRFPDRCLAFDQFGPLSIRPCHGSTWARESRPNRLPATYTRTHGIRYFHGCYSLGDDQLWGVTRRRKGGDHTLAAPGSIRAERPDGANAPESAANTTAAGADPLPHDPVNLCGHRTSHR